MVKCNLPVGLQHIQKAVRSTVFTQVSAACDGEPHHPSNEAAHNDSWYR